MTQQEIAWQEQRLEELLYTDLDPVIKVRKIMALGFPEEVANELVERQQLGLQSPVYYESLRFVDEPDDEVDFFTD